MPTAVVTGANSGIANAFAKVLLDEGYKVYAVDRNLGEGLAGLKGAEVSELDVTSMASIATFKEKFGDQPLDLLLNIAGVAFLDKDSIDTTNLDIFQKTFAVNTFGPMFLTQSLLPNLLKAESAKIGIVTSRVGSMADNSSGGIYAYRASKAAANSIGKSMAVDLKDKNVTVLLLHPGMVRSGMLPDTKDPQVVEPVDSATKLWNNVVNVKGLESTGKFYHRDGHELPW